MMIYNLIKKMDTRRKDYNTFFRKKNRRKINQYYHNEICTWKRDSFSSEIEITRGNRLNKDIKKENFRKCPINLIETNHQINMTSDHSVSSNMSFKSHFNAKSFNMILIIMLPSVFEKHKTCLNRTKSLLIVN